MPATTLSVLIAASALLAASPLAAEEAAAPTIVIVTGLSPDDLLNVRATASAFGVVLGQLPNGSNLKNYGCGEVQGYPWCRVEEVGNPKLAGWAPARYLHLPGASEPNIAAMAVVEEPAADVEPSMAADPAEMVRENPPDAPRDLTVGANGDNIFLPGKAPDADRRQDVAATGSVKDSAMARPSTAQPEHPAVAEARHQNQVSLPVDLMARLGVDQAAAPAAPPKSAASIGQTAAQDAYGLAFAAREAPANDKTDLPAQAREETDADGLAPMQNVAAAPADEPASAGDADPASAVAGDETVPVPTPRPEQAEAPLLDTQPAPFLDRQTVAQVQSPLPPVEQPAGAAPADPPRTLPAAFDATGEIPCARYIGQPMTRCEASVARTGADAAEVTVAWPDGGTRVIDFKAGKPEGANSRGEFRFTREGNLSMIRVGVSERFEIPDAMAFGD